MRIHPGGVTRILYSCVYDTQPWKTLVWTCMLLCIFKLYIASNRKEKIYQNFYNKLVSNSLFQWEHSCTLFFFILSLRFTTGKSLEDPSGAWLIWVDKMGCWEHLTCVDTSIRASRSQPEYWYNLQVTKTAVSLRSVWKYSSQVRLSKDMKDRM